ncbi:MAG: tetratricopeptide repeat protein, partial [Myxococcota bacterium]
MWRLLGPIAMLVLMACSARCPLPPASHPPELSHPADPELAQRIAERSRAFELAHRAAHEEACAANHAAKLRCIEAVEARRNAMHALAGEARVLLRLEVPAAYYALEEQLDECGRGWWVAYPRATEPDGAAELDAALLLDARRRLPALVDAHAHHLESLRGSDPVYRADRLAALGDAALRLRRLDIAEARYREALEQSQGLPWLVRRGEAGLSVVASQRRQHEQAADHRRRALAVSLEVRQAVWVRNDERAVRSYSIANSAGASRLSTGEQSLFSPQSDNVFSTTLEANRARYGEGHPIVASDRVLLGQVLGLADRPEASREAIEQALRELADAYGPAHRSLIGPLRSLASLDTRQGRPRRAIRLLERAIAIATPYGQDGRASAGRSRLALGRLLAERGQTQSALAVLRQARNDLDAG